MVHCCRMSCPAVASCPSGSMRWLAVCPLAGDGPDSYGLYRWKNHLIKYTHYHDKKSIFY